MSFQVSQKGNVFFVEDTAGGRIVARMGTKEGAESYAKQLAGRQKDYFKDVKTNIRINSEEM
jgi:hypothetical protein